MKTIRWIAVIGVAALASARGIDFAVAQSPVCTQLETQLVALDRGAVGPGPSAARSYDEPIARQQHEIDLAMAEARSSGCVGGFLIFKPRPAPKCGELMATIERMRANLHRLQTSRGRAGGDPRSAAEQRARLLQALSANGCGQDYAGFGVRRGGSLLENLFGRARFRTWGEDSFFSGAQYGTYRTLCVRTCDGYYFPISFSTLPARFPQDQQTCQAMCPGTDAALYTHRNPGQDTDQMVSLFGEPYTALPTAFRYRQSYDPACSCRSAETAAFGGPGSEQTGPAATLALPAYTGPVIPLPLARPVRGDDPETTANRAGGLVPQLPGQDSPAHIAAAGGDGAQRQIRIVGPAFYYGQETAEGSP